jgi:hypothetical protein
MPLVSGSFQTLFIGPEDLKQNSIIQGSVDDTYTLSSIQTAQMLWIQEVIGTPLMVDLQNKINNLNGIGLNSNETFLLNAFIRPALIWFAAYELAYLNHYKIQNKGLEKMTGESSTAASLNELQSYQDMCQTKAQAYAQQCIRYLQTFPQNFLAWMSSPMYIADIPPMQSAMKRSTYLGRAMNRGQDERDYLDYFWPNY